MKYNIYKLNLKNAHFGNGTLASSEAAFTADRLYSALYMEALNLGKEKEFFDLTKSNDFRMSDAFPYMEEPYLPFPVDIPQGIIEQKDLKESYQMQAAAKKIKYLPMSLWEDLWKGAVTVAELLNYQDGLFVNRVETKKGVDPFNVGVSYYNGTSLYIIATPSELFDTLMQSLQYTGIGGKKSSGYGTYQLEKLDLPSEFEGRLNFGGRKSMLLSTSLPRDNELDEVMTDAKYKLVKRSGYVYSESAAHILKKQVLYKFKAGSIFGHTYQGDIYDVRPKDFEHSVWSYSKALFYQI